MLLQDLPRSVAPPATRMARQLAGAALHRASRVLAKLARQLLHAERRPAADPVIEFYAEAGAPEGALYVDGQLVGRLAGVSRL